jgi:hypothetical protein
LLELQNQELLEKDHWELLKIIYDTFVSKKEEILFQELCNNISLDYEKIINDSV